MKFRNFFNFSQSPILNALSSQKRPVDKIKGKGKKAYLNAMEKKKSLPKRELDTRIQVLAEKMEYSLEELFHNASLDVQDVIEDNEEKLNAIMQNGVSEEEAKEIVESLIEASNENKATDPKVNGFDSNWNCSIYLDNDEPCKYKRNFIVKAGEFLLSKGIKELDKVAHKDLVNSPEGVVNLQFFLFKEAIRAYYWYVSNINGDVKEVSNVLYLSTKEYKDKKENNPNKPNPPKSLKSQTEEVIEEYEDTSKDTSEGKSKSKSKTKTKNRTVSAKETPENTPEDLPEELS